MSRKRAARKNRVEAVVRTPQIPLNLRVVILTDDEPSPAYLALMRRLLLTRTDEGQVAA